MLNYAAVKVSDVERSGSFYDSILAPHGWRRQEAPANAVSWGFVKAEKIRGKAFLIYWSWNGDRHWLRWRRLGNWLP